jgi:hypothetical protein
MMFEFFVLVLRPSSHVLEKEKIEDEGRGTKDEDETKGANLRTKALRKK